MKAVVFRISCWFALEVGLAVAFQCFGGLIDADKRWDAAGGFWRANVDEDKVKQYELEDPCTFLDGTVVRTADDWSRRRQEILGIFAREMFGAEPPAPEALVCDLVGEKVTAAGFAVRRFFRMYFRADRSGPCIEWCLWLPRHAKGPVPVILFLNYRGVQELVDDPDLPICRSWLRNDDRWDVRRHVASEKTRGSLSGSSSDTIFPLQMILARGYAVLSACYADVSPDPLAFGKDGVDQYPFATTNGVFTLWGPRDERRTDNITAIGAWAWALSRGLDLAGRQPEIDVRRSVVTGCSRLGKAAFLAAARDERFAVCVPNQCGGGGVCLAKRDFGENISTEIVFFRHWYCKAYDKYASDPAGLLTFDQHLLLASIAPRYVLVQGFSPSDWMDTKAEFLACQAASPAWERLGLPGLPKVEFPKTYDTSAIGRRLGYVRRTEKHGISGCDWQWLMDFADRAWKEK